jgi:hypothetical protein
LKKIKELKKDINSLNHGRKRSVGGQLVQLEKEEEN